MRTTGPALLAGDGAAAADFDVRKAGKTEAATKLLGTN